MSDRTARERFVEAMRALRAHAVAMKADPNGVVLSWALQAADAFADEGCKQQMAASMAGAPRHSQEEHATCRATLRKECGVE